MRNANSTTTWLVGATAVLGLASAYGLLRGGPWLIVGGGLGLSAVWLGLVTWLSQLQVGAERLADDGDHTAALARLEHAHRIAVAAPLPSVALGAAAPGLIRMRIAALENRYGRPAVAERHLRDAIAEETNLTRLTRLEGGLAALLAEQGRMVEASEQYHRLITRLSHSPHADLLSNALSGAIASQLAMELLIEVELTDEAAPQGHRMRDLLASSEPLPCAQRVEAALHLAQWAELRCDWGAARRWITGAKESCSANVPEEMAIGVHALAARLTALTDDLPTGIAALEACEDRAREQDVRTRRPGWLEIHVATDRAELLALAEDWEAAEPLVDHLQALIDAHPGRPHPRATRVGYLKARCRLAAGDRASALAQADTALSVLEHRGETETPESARHLLVVAEASAALASATSGDKEGPGEREISLRRALAIVELNPGAYFVPLVTALQAWGELLTERGEHEDARPHLERALSICRARLPDAHPYRVTMEERLSRVLAA